MEKETEKIIKDLYSALVQISRYLDAHQENRARQDKLVIAGFAAYDRFLALQQRGKRRGKKARAILALLAKRGPLTGRAIHEALDDGTVRSATYVTLKRLVHDGEVILSAVDVPSGHSVHQYSINRNRVQRKSEKD